MRLFLTFTQQIRIQFYMYKIVKQIHYSFHQQSKNKMSYKQHKLEQLSLLQIKRQVIKAEPDLSALINTLSEVSLRQKYEQLLRKKYQQANSDIIIAQIAESTNIDIDQGVILPNKIMLDKPKSQQIRVSLISNFPHLKEAIKAFSAQQLYQLYYHSIDKNKTAFNSSNPMIIKMVNEVLSTYPSIRHKIHLYTQAQIQKMYYSIRPRNQSIQIESHSSKVSQKQNTNRFDQMRREMITQFPAGAQFINQLSDAQLLIFYNEESKPMQTTLNEHQFFSNTHSIFPRISPISQQLLVPSIETWSMEHPHNEFIKAKTYLMIHTQYQRLGELKGNSSSKECKCSCCKDKTIQVLCKQLINSMNKDKQ